MCERILYGDRQTTIYLLPDRNFISLHNYSTHLPMFQVLRKFFRAKATEKKTPIFKDEELQRQFDERRFVVFDLLNREEINHLHNLYNSLPEHNYRQDGLEVTMFDPVNGVHIKELGAEILKVMKPAMDRYFRNYRALATNFLVKHKTEQSTIYPHQDSTMVDEDKFYSISLWTPLVDIDMPNGNMGFVEGPDRLAPLYRALYNNPFAPFSQALHPFVKYIPLKAGQALAYDLRILHATTPNETPEPRLVAAAALVSEQAELWHCVPAEEKNTMDVYKVDPDFFLNFNVKALTQNSKPFKRVTNPEITWEKIRAAIASPSVV
jgi:Phytanoyl-CoA dioxygenase (PhyH)